MGYTTEFQGQFHLDRPLDDATFERLVLLSTTRRMQRDTTKLPPGEWGEEGEFFGGENDSFGQEPHPSIIDFNRPPKSQPGLWCKWTPTEDRMGLEWSGQEKFYDYTEWLCYLIDAVLSPRGYRLNGEVKWQGEEMDDRGIITVVGNDVSTRTLP